MPTIASTGQGGIRHRERAVQQVGAGERLRAEVARLHELERGLARGRVGVPAAGDDEPVRRTGSAGRAAPAVWSASSASARSGSGGSPAELVGAAAVAGADALDQQQQGEQFGGVRLGGGDRQLVPGGDVDASSATWASGEPGGLVTARVSAPRAGDPQDLARSGEPPLWLTPTTSASGRSGRLPYTVTAPARRGPAGRPSRISVRYCRVEGGVVAGAPRGEDDVPRPAPGDLGRDRGDRVSALVEAGGRSTAGCSAMSGAMRAPAWAGDRYLLSRSLSALHRAGGQAGGHLPLDQMKRITTGIVNSVDPAMMRPSRFPPCR